ncbi:PaaX family transcriptional regulator C-terminal domain-containing protein [Variovorax boronicumulans]|uniref:PaaX family transcriptional regulator C-terminal domain-containing protein n=1 Tax=Variovorax boronicumulans TaxID=436515 RepID=UPI00277E9500|nr:PaaX family transcriptional regulator C-terminal domain-containing protein [Variovorax boronicumulans]MDQ0045123.1 phenylacetic acid degradation operon negative regulatory protein [Variovorax boronicumulans]
MEKICNVPVAIPSAPELILDLLVAHSGMLSAQSLCRAGALMGIGESTLRVGLTRLASDGKIERSERGSYALNRAGPALSRAVDGWRQHGAQAVAWRNDWLAVHDAGVPRSDKTAWRHHGLALSLRGFAPLQTGLHIRPDNLRGGLAAEREQLQGLGLSSKALVFRLADMDEATQAAARKLWNVRALTAGYQRLQSGIERSEKRLDKLPLEAAVRESLLLGRAVIAHLIRDPLLPAELMSPAPRTALQTVTRRYQDKARKLWREWFAQA